MSQLLLSRIYFLKLRVKHGLFLHAMHIYYSQQNLEFAFLFEGPFFLLKEENLIIQKWAAYNSLLLKFRFRFF